MENSLESIRILDATCSIRSIWYQKKHPFVTFLDKRYETINMKTENLKFKDCTTLRIHPDIIAEWQSLPFKDGVFDMIVFDPPHIIANRDNKLSGMQKKYGLFYKDNWRRVLGTGIIELFRVLRSNGTFILKWCEVDKKVDEVIQLIPYPPMFGTRTGQANKNHWIVFIKYQLNKSLEDTNYETEVQTYENLGGGDYGQIPFSRFTQSQLDV